MRKISLQWRLTILTTVLITILCGCLTFFLYKNGVYYFDTLQESVTDHGTKPEAVYIDIPDNEWDDFVAQFSTKVYNSKSDYRTKSLLITVVVALFGGAVTYFISGRALKPLREFSETVEKVQIQNLTDYTYCFILSSISFLSFQKHNSAKKETAAIRKFHTNIDI